MNVFDVFNGDADGICALVQLRRAEPRPEARLVTGVKRDIKLLQRVDAKRGDILTVLDISMRSNQDALLDILNVGADVFYIDHHNAGTILDHSGLDAVVDTSPAMCTALIVDTLLEGRYRAWAVAAAFGDNFATKAKQLGGGLPLDDLKRLGELINYNAYGARLEDLHFHPADLFKALVPYDTPMEFMAARPEIVNRLSDGFKHDLSQAKQAVILDKTSVGLIVDLGGSVSARRISGIYSNQLANEHPERAHAVLTHVTGGFLVSVRAPLARRRGADRLCLQFKTGGGRPAAAGINLLAKPDLDRFIKAFRDAFTME